MLEAALNDVPIRFVFNSGEVSEAESESVRVADGTVQRIEFVLDPHRWFQNVDAGRLHLGNDEV